MSFAAARPARHLGRFWVAGGAVATIVVSGLFWIDSPVRRWLLERVLQASPGAQARDEAAASSVLPPEATVVAFGLVDVEGGEVKLSPQAPGKVVDVHVSDGARVKAGAPLLKLGSVLAENRLAQAREVEKQARLKLQIAHRGPKLYIERIKEQTQAVAGARELQEGIREGMKDLEQLSNETLVEGRMNSEQRKLNMASAKLEAERRKLEQVKLMDPAEEIELAESDLIKAKAAVAEAKEFLEQHTLTAPENGVILRVMASKGQVLGNLLPPAISFRPDRKILLRCEVNQEFADRLNVGGRAEVYWDNFAGKKWPGKVTRLSDWMAPRRSQLDEPFEKNDVRTLEAIVEFQTEPPALRQGQRLRVVFLQD